jgi:hypothetical protein
MAKKRTKKSEQATSTGAVEASSPSTELASEAAAPTATPSVPPASDVAAAGSSDAPSIPLPGDEAALDATAEAAGEAPVSLSPPSMKKKKKSTKKKRADGERVSALPETVREGRMGAPSEPPPKVDAAALDAKLEKLEAKLGEKKDAHKAAREGFASDPGADDISVPPVVDLDEHDHFFAAGENVQRVSHSGASGSFAAIDPRHAQKMSAEAHARRAHLSRYVKAALAVSAGLLALGLVFNKMRPNPADQPAKVAVVQHTPDVPTETTPPAPKDAPPPATAAATVAAPEPSASVAASAAPTDTAPPVASVTAPAASASTDVVAPAKTAAQEKATSKAALESGAFGMAVAAGERSVGLDAGDGEAWLLLGAAYDSLGNKAQARRCYNACVAKAKRGPIDECRQMLSQ